MMPKSQINSLIVGLLVLAILSLLSNMVESHYFWKRVAEVRMLTGTNNSFEAAGEVATEPNTVIMGLLTICIRYSIAVYIALIGIRQSILTNAVLFGLVAVVLANIIKAFWGIGSVVNYPWITLLEVVVALIMCTVIGYFMQWKAKKSQDAT